MTKQVEFENVDDPRLSELREHDPGGSRRARKTDVTGDRYRGAWWRRVVKPGLKSLPDVEAPARRNRPQLPHVDLSSDTVADEKVLPLSDNKLDIVTLCLS